MKLNPVKTLLSLGISALLGLLCCGIAQDADYRNWISFATATVSIFCCLVTAIACDYKSGYRNANIKVCAWIFTVLVTVANFVFSCFTYNILVYVALMAILTLINIGLVYTLHKPQKDVTE